MSLRIWPWLMAIGTMTIGTGIAASQPLSSRPIRIVASEAGGSNDFSARLIAQGMSASLNQSVIVENRAGGGGTAAGEYVMKATPDGHTLLVYGGSIWLLPYLRDHVPWVPLRDFAPVSLTTRQFNVLVVNSSVPVSNAKDLIALARAKPGELNYGTGSTGAATHLAAELMKSMAGMNIVRVAYKGNGPAMTALLANETQMMFVATGGAMTLVRSGKVKGLAVTSLEPTPLAPDLPTLASSGLPGYESVGLFGMFAPAKTPAAVIQQINHVTTAFLLKADTKQKYFDTGIDVVASSPKEFADKIREDMAKMGKVIKDAGIREE